jgi:hypothetical protein
MPVDHSVETARRAALSTRNSLPVEGAESNGSGPLIEPEQGLIRQALPFGVVHAQIVDDPSEFCNCVGIRRKEPK